MALSSKTKPGLGATLIALGSLTAALLGLYRINLYPRFFPTIKIEGHASGLRLNEQDTLKVTINGEDAAIGQYRCSWNEHAETTSLEIAGGTSSDDCSHRVVTNFGTAFVTADSQLLNIEVDVYPKSGIPSSSLGHAEHKLLLRNVSDPAIFIEPRIVYLNGTTRMSALLSGREVPQGYTCRWVVDGIGLKPQGQALTSDCRAFTYRAPPDMAEQSTKRVSVMLTVVDRSNTVVGRKLGVLTINRPLSVP